MLVSGNIPTWSLTARPWKVTFPKEKETIVFQASIFRCYVSFREHTHLKFNSSPVKSYLPKRKGLSSNHPFSFALAVSFREGWFPSKDLTSSDLLYIQKNPTNLNWKVSGMDLVGCFVLIDVGDCAGIPCSFILGKHSNFKINQYAKKVLEHVHGSRVTSHATMPERLAISVTKLKFS